MTEKYFFRKNNRLLILTGMACEGSVSYHGLYILSPWPRAASIIILEKDVSVCPSAVETYGARTEEVQPGPQHGTPKTVADRPQPTDDYGNEKLSLGLLWNGTAHIQRNWNKMTDRPQPTKIRKKVTARPQHTKNAKKSDRQTTTHTHDRASLRRVTSQPRRPGVSSKNKKKSKKIQKLLKF